jgi:hypothetical protein
MASKNKNSKTETQTKRPFIRSPSVLSDTSLEIPNLSGDDNDDDGQSTSGRRNSAHK